MLTILVGGFSLDLSKMYPDLKFIVQDRGPVIEKAKGVWAEGAPEAIASGRVTLMPHDIFQPNPVKEADIYFLRCILYVSCTVAFATV